MENTENTVAAEGGMIDEETQAQNEEVKASELMQDGGAQGEESGESQEENAQTSQDGQVKAYTEGITGLYDAGWTQEEVAALIADPDALRDIMNGKTVGQAGHAYMRRQMQAANAYAIRMMNAGQEAKPHAKTGVPSVRKAASSDAKPTMSIDDMDDKQFEEFSRLARQAAMEGKKVRM